MMALLGAPLIRKYFGKMATGIISFPE
ncbi:hypothetical protein AAH077_00005 [Bacteroides fragilis]